MLMKIKLSMIKLATYSRSSIQNINNWTFRTWKNKFITKFNRKPTNIDKIYLHAKDLYEEKYK